MQAITKQAAYGPVVLEVNEWTVGKLNTVIEVSVRVKASGCFGISNLWNKLSSCDSSLNVAVVILYIIRDITMSQINCVL